MRYAHIQAGTVVNLIIWDGTTPLDVDGELVLLDDDSPVGRRWQYENGEFIPAPPREGDPNRP